MNEIENSLKRLVHRLEDAKSEEKLEALRELQILSRSNASVVGDICLQRVLDFLREQGSPEEYQESLDLIYRLVKSRDTDAAIKNAEIILDDIKNVELFLDLLENEDLTVGVMTSQILTEVHAHTGASLESKIQDCPTGMNKLLHCLLDSSREEVRNQAIVFIQQLTSSNEEMKKTVVFNEGFEILFGIINSEGGFRDSGLVVQDCLQICSNILCGSETCSRLFFAMGSEWTMRLSEYFHPESLESTIDQGGRINGGELGDGDSDDGAGGYQEWYNRTDRIKCANLALEAIVNALAIANKKHQASVAITVGPIIPSVVFFIARRGPVSLAKLALALLIRLVADNNASTSAHILGVTLKVSPAAPGKTVPLGTELPQQLLFGWKPLPSDDRRCISLPLLLAERYVFPLSPWTGSASGPTPFPGCFPEALGTIDMNSAEGFGYACLVTLEHILAADEMGAGMMVQFVLAPPPPTPDEDPYAVPDFGAPRLGSSPLDNAKPLGTILISIVVDLCFRLLDTSSLMQAPGAAGGKASLQYQIDAAVKCMNVLSLFFLHGGSLSRELSTALNTSHATASVVPFFGRASATPPQTAPQPLLPLLLASAGRALRALGQSTSSAQSLVTATLRLLAVAVSRCDRAARQLLEDPSNLFVIDLASASSDTAGATILVQVVACLFVGSCFHALGDSAEDHAHEEASSSGTRPGTPRLTQKAFLSMVDSRVGLTRLTDMLRKPIVDTRSAASNTNALATELYISPGFKIFYKSQVEAIRNAIFDFYSKSSVVMNSDKLTPEQQVIEMQKQKIAELEYALRSSSSSTDINDPCNGHSKPTERDSEEELKRLKEEKDLLAARVEVSEKSFEDLLLAFEEESHARVELTMQLERVSADNAALLNYSQQTGDIGFASSSSFFEGGSSSDEVIALKESVVRLKDERQQLKQALDQSHRRIQLLEEELRSPVPLEVTRDNRISELEKKNEDLVQALESARLASASAGATAASATESISLNEFAAIVEAVHSFQLGLGMDEDSCIYLTQGDRTASEMVGDVTVALEECRDGVYQAAGYCSDVYEGAVRGLVVADTATLVLDGREGTVKRVVSCCDHLRSIVSIFEDKLLEDRDMYEAKISEEAMASVSAQDRMSEFVEEINSLREELNGLRRQRDERKTEAVTILPFEAVSEAENGELIKVPKAAMDAAAFDFEVILHALHSFQLGLGMDKDSCIYLTQGDRTTSEMVGDVTAALQELRAELPEKLDRASEESSSSQSRISGLVKEVKSLQEALEEATIRSTSLEPPSPSRGIEDHVESNHIAIERLKKEKNDAVLTVKKLEIEISTVMENAEVNLREAVAERNQALLDLQLLEDETSKLKEQLVDVCEAKEIIKNSHEQLLAAHADEVVAYEQRCNELTRQIFHQEQQKQEIASLQAQPIAQGSDVVPLYTRLSDLTSQLNAETQRVSELTDRLQKAEAEGAASIYQTETLIESLNAEVASLTAARIDVEKEKQRDLEEVISRLAEERSANVSINSQVALLTEELTSARKQAEEIVREKEAALETRDAELRELRAGLETVTKQLEHWEKMLADTSAAHQEQTAQLETWERALADTSAAHEEEKEKLEFEIAHLTELLRTQTEDAAEAVELKSRQIVELEAEMSQLRSARTEMEAAFATLERRLQNSDSANVQLAAEVEASRVRNAEAERLKEEVKQVGEELRLSKESLTSMSFELELFGKTYEERDDFLSRAGEYDSMASEVAQWKAQVASLQAKLAEAEEQAHFNQNFWLDLKAQNRARADSLERVNEEIQSLKAENQELTASLTTQTLAAQEALADQEVWVELKIRHLKVIAELAKYKEDDQHATHALTAELALKSAELYNFKEKAETTAREMEQLQLAYQSLQAAYAAAVEDSKDMVNRLEQLDAIGARTVGDNSTDALALQKHEILRMSADITSLTRDLRLREREVKAATDAISRREGELAGIRSLLLDTQEEMEKVKEENLTIVKQKMTDDRAIRELQRKLSELEMDLQFEREEVLRLKKRSQGEVKAISNGWEDEFRSAVSVIGSTTEEVARGIQAISKFSASSSRLVITDLIASSLSSSSSSELGAGADAGVAALRVKANQLGRVSDRLRSTVAEVERELTEKKEALAAQGRQLEQREKELAEVLQAQLSMRTPMLTPGPSKSNRGVLTAASRATPASGHKEVFKLYSEVKKERRRLQVLQEEHTDLLGLLAQQEVELGVFRSTVQSKLGAEAVRSAEEKAQLLATRKYGEYTNYRVDMLSSDDMDSLEGSDTEEPKLN